MRHEWGMVQEKDFFCASVVVKRVFIQGRNKLRKNSIQLGFLRVLYQGTTSVVPQVPQNQRGL
jgi:hypothetical protein